MKNLLACLGVVFLLLLLATGIAAGIHVYREHRLAECQQDEKEVEIAISHARWQRRVEQARRLGVMRIEYVGLQMGGRYSHFQARKKDGTLIELPVTTGLWVPEKGQLVRIRANGSNSPEAPWIAERVIPECQEARQP